jgi:predicted nucleotidyltransferase
MVKQSVISIAIKFIRQIPADIRVKKAYLFGSCAKGLEKEDSDIDIALVVESMTDFFSTQMQLMRTRRNVDLRIEPHPIDESDFSSTNPFAAEIQKSGIEIPTDLSNVREVVVRN